MKLSTKLLILLLVIPGIVIGLYASTVSAQVEDPIDGEDQVEDDIEPEESVVEDGGGDSEKDKDVLGGDVDEEEELDELEKPLEPSPDVETTLLFPRYPTGEIQAGQLIKCLIGFRNKGNSDFSVDYISASLRYPHDYTYYIQNFTTVKYNRVVEPATDATFLYAFHPHESFSGRPFGVSVIVNYHGALEEELFEDAVFNQTVTLVELDEGLDAEIFFLYVFLVAIAVLLAVGAQQLFVSLRKRSRSSRSTLVGFGGAGGSRQTGVDYDWLPEDMVREMKRSSPKKSPSAAGMTRRSAKRKAGSGKDD